MEPRQTVAAAAPSYQPRAWAWTAAAALTAAGLLIASYMLPTVRFKAVGSDEEIYTIWGGIVSLWQDGNVFLAPVVFLFSMVFPVAKLAALGWAWSVRRDHGRGRALLDALQHLGKWSMLDVLIIALFVGSIRIGIATASSKPGILLFAFAIAVSMIAARLAAHARLDGAPAPRRIRKRPSWLHRATSVLAAATLTGVLFQPLLEIKKGFLFTNEVGVVATSTDMTQTGEAGLGVMLLAVAAILPAIRCLLSLRIAYLPGSARHTARLARLVEEWAMPEVFALALAIAHVKLAELTNTTLLPGFTWALVAGLLAVIDGVVVERVTRPKR